MYFRLGDLVRVREGGRLPELVGTIGKVVAVGGGGFEGRVSIHFCEPQIISGSHIYSHEGSAYAFELVNPPTTAFAQLLRSLHEHRDEMRDMMEIIHEHDAEEAFEERLMTRTGNNPRWLGRCEPGECDRCSPTTILQRMCWDCVNATFVMDCPEMAALRAENVALRRELSDRQNFIAAVRSMAQRPAD